MTIPKEYPRILPHTEATTVIWADKDILKHSQWYAALGDDLERQRAAIEINLPKIMQGRTLEETTEQVIKSWLSIYVILATRQDLINKGVRGNLSAEGENILCRANYEAILISPLLFKKYSNLAIQEILEGKKYPGDIDTIQLYELLESWKEGGMIRELELRGKL